MTSASHELRAPEGATPLGNHTKIVLLPSTKLRTGSAHREAVFQRALAYVEAVDADLTSGRRHYRNRAGVLLNSLDQVVQAILDNDLAITESTFELAA